MPGNEIIPRMWIPMNLWEIWKLQFLPVTQEILVKNGSRHRYRNK